MMKHWAVRSLSNIFMFFVEILCFLKCLEYSSKSEPATDRSLKFKPSCLA